jgi:tetratricopeptide (TPR) repeat protein
VVELGGRVRGWLGASLLLVAPGLAWAEPPAEPASSEGNTGSAEARSLELRAQANTAYIEGRYDEALLLLERANALAPYAQHSFNLGAVQHRLGRCELARDLFARYLSADPDGPARADAEHALEELHAQCGRGPGMSDVAPAVVRPPPAPGLMESPIVPGGSSHAAQPMAPAAVGMAGLVPVEPESRPSVREVAAWSSLAVGGAAAVTAGASLVLLRRAESDLEALVQDRVWNAEEARALASNGERYQALAFASAFGSALLLGTGVALLLLEEPDASVRVRVSGDASLLYTRRF